MYAYTLSSKFRCVHLFYYHIKTISLWSNYWKNTKAKKKEKAHLPRLKNTHRFRSSIYLIIKLYTLRTQTPRTKLIQTEANPPFLSPWKGHSEPIHSKKSKLGKRGHLEAMDILWKDPQVGLRQNTVLGLESGSFGWYRNSLGNWVRHRHGFPVMTPHSAGACSSWSTLSMLSVLSTKV